MSPKRLSAGLVVRSAEPLNCEASMSALAGATVTPNANFYIRNHFPIPAIDVALWRLHVGGLVRRPLHLDLTGLRSLPSQSKTVTMECAGNGRSFMTPAVGGEQWGLGAVSTAEWTGVPLAEVLDRAGVKSTAREIVFRGADRAPGQDSKGATGFERSLSLDDVRQTDVLLAYAMNGEPLPIEHGHPLRVVVPGWYGVAGVKWLTEMEVIDHSFTGYYQTQKYVYEVERGGRVSREPVTKERVRALITQPIADQVIELGELPVSGLAWSGMAPVARVDVSINGQAWQQARLLDEGPPFSWQRWQLTARVERRGRTTIRARASDLAGRTQPEKPEWNRLGYGNNAVQEVAITAS